MIVPMAAMVRLEQPVGLIDKEKGRGKAATKERLWYLAWDVSSEKRVQIISAYSVF
jgi:hypothetical protein